MSHREPAAVLAGIPGWEGARFEPLAGGLTNTGYRVFKHRQSAVLKFDDTVRQAPFNTRCEEAAVQSRAAKAGIAPTVISVDEQILFSEFLEGDVWTRSSLDEDNNLISLACALKQVHELPLTGRVFDANAAAEVYLARNRHLDANTVTLCLRTIANTPLPQQLRCCHNDLVAENFVSTPQLKILDWEYACDNDPLFDLATVVEHHALGDTQVRTLLDAYFDGDGNRWRQDLATQRTLYLALYVLWSASRPDCDPSTLATLLERLSTSCS